MGTGGGARGLPFRLLPSLQEAGQGPGWARGPRSSLSHQGPWRVQKGERLPQQGSCGVAAPSHPESRGRLLWEAVFLLSSASFGNCSPRCSYNRFKTYVCPQPGTQTFVAALFVTADNGKQPRRPSVTVDKQTDVPPDSGTLLAVKRNELSATKRHG